VAEAVARVAAQLGFPALEGSQLNDAGVDRVVAQAEQTLFGHRAGATACGHAVAARPFSSLQLSFIPESCSITQLGSSRCCSQSGAKGLVL
jgi:hypothetical protein